jgi:hypothetical protein
MDKLCIATNAIVKIKSTTIATTKTLLNKSKHSSAAATAANTSGATINSCSNTQDEANHLNLIHQAMSGAKEGTTKAITTKVGTDVMNAILNTANGSNFKSIDDWQLEDVLATVVQGADCPNTADILAQLLHIIQFLFDFRKNISANMERLRSKAERMHSYGVTINDTQLALVLLANIDLVTSKDWGCKFHPALQTIRHQYAYNYVHNTTSIHSEAQRCPCAQWHRQCCH